MKKITNIAELDLNKQYTYADYLTWRFEERIELIKGWVYKMNPAPKRVHQDISINITGLLLNFFENNPCKLYNAPFDVRLVKNKGQQNKEINTVIQPDISVICDISKLDDAGCIGTPDLIVEILSPSTAKKDYNEKFNLYQENGVKEYWIASPEAKTIEVFFLENKKYKTLEIFNEYDGYTEVCSQLFPELKISLKDIFKE